VNAPLTTCVNAPLTPACGRAAHATRVDAPLTPRAWTLRDCRYVVGIKLHTKGMTVADGARMFTEL